MPGRTSDHAAAESRFARLNRMLADGQEVLVWVQARHPGRRVRVRIEFGVFDPVDVVGVEVLLDDLPAGPEASAAPLRAMRALGWSPSGQRSTALMEPLWPEEVSAHRRLEVIRRIEEALRT